LKIKILIDHVSRELNFAARLKVYVESNGLGSVEISHQDYINTVVDYDFFEATFSGEYDVIITPSYNVSRTPEILLRAVASKSKIVVYHSEQIFNDQFIPEKLNTNFKISYDNHISAHFVWGEYYAEKLIKHACVDPCKIYIVGNYKFDFLKNNSDASKLKTVLFASDYKAADYSNKDLAIFSKEYKVTLPTGINNIIKQARDEALKWIKEAAVKYPDVKFCLRPHPGEKTCSYNKLNYLDNVEVSNMSRAYSEDLLKSCLVIGYTSTSVLEILKANKMFYSLKTGEYDLSYLADHKDLLTWITKEEFFKVISSVSAEELIYPAKHDIEKLNKLVEPYDDVVINVALALVDVNESSLSIRLLPSDIFRLCKSIFVGSLKYASIAFSNRYPKFYFSRVILFRSEKSYQERVASAEIIDDEKVRAEMLKVEWEGKIPTKKIKTDSGWRFIINECE
jgi:surface carbohydrate biosynthesis protein